MILVALLLGQNYYYPALILNNDYFSYTQDTLNLLSTLEMIIKNAEEKAGIIPSENNLNLKDKWS